MHWHERVVEEEIWLVLLESWSFHVHIITPKAVDMASKHAEEDLVPYVYISCNHGGKVLAQHVWRTWFVEEGKQRRCKVYRLDQCLPAFMAFC